MTYSKEQLNDMIEEETPTVFERLWDAFVDFMTLVGMVATVCFIAGYVIYKQPSSVTQCNKTEDIYQAIEAKLKEKNT